LQKNIEYMADNALGISGSLDISDIIKSIDQLYDEIGKIEGISKEMAAELERAYTAVGKASKEELEEKSRKALEVFSKAFEDAKASADKNVTKIESSIERLQEKLSKISVERSDTVTGTKTYDRLTRQMESLNTQIHNQQQTLERARIAAQEAGDNYSTFLSQVASANSALDAFNALNAAATVGTGLNAAAHGGAAAAIGVESAARAKNTAEIANEKDALDAEKGTLKEVEETLEKASYNNTPIGSAIATLEESLKKLRDTNENVLKSIDAEKDADKLDELNNRYLANIETIRKLEDELANLKDIAGQGYKTVEEYNAKQKETAEKLKPEDVKEYWDAIANIGQRAKDYYDALPNLLGRIKEQLKDINETPMNAQFLGELRDAIIELEKVKSSKDFLTGQDGSQLSRMVELFEKLSDSEVKLNQMAAEDPWKVQGLSLAELNQRLDENKRKQEELNKELEKLDKKKVSETSKEYVELKQKIEATKKEQELLNNELQGRSSISKFWANIKGNLNDFGSSIKNTFSSLKGGFSSGGSGVSGFFSLLTSGKFWGWATAIGAVAGGVKKLSDEAESLNKAMKPLKAYVDDDTLGKLRESFINTAYQGSAQSTEDMAAAAARWIKYYEGLRKAPEAIQAVVDASRDLATITDTSADKAAESLTKLGGQFNQTAQEAKDNVNVIVNATRNSTVSYDEMISALVSSGAKVRLNGSTFKEYAAAVSLTSAQYGGASQAASAYQLILQKLSTETNNNFNPKVVGVTKAFQNLHKAMENGEDLHKKFGTRLWSQAQYFIKNANEIANYTEKLEGADGKLAALNSKEETAEHNQKELQNAMAALAQEINLNLTPAFVAVIDTLTNIVTWCHNAGGAIKDFFTDIDNWLKDNLGERMYDALFVDENALWDSNYKSKWSGKQKVKWTERETRKEYRNLLEKRGTTLGNAQIVLKAYDDNDSSGLSREEVQQIIREENEKWLKDHKVLSSSTVKGGSDVVGNENAVTDPNAENKEAEQKAARREKLFEEEQKQREALAKQRQALRYAIAEAGIASERNASERERKEQELQHQKNLDSVDAREEEMKKAIYAHNKAVWEAKNKNKKLKYSDTEEGAAGWANLELSEEQLQELAALRKKYNESYSQQVTERIKNEEKANREAINSYLKQYGDYAQKKKAIYDDANAEICELEEHLSRTTDNEARTAIQARIDTVKAGTKEQIEELDLQYGKAKQFMIDLFGDASQKSVAEIEKIIKKYEELEKFLQGDKSVSRESLISLGFTDKEIDQALEKLSQGKITVKDFTDALKNMRGELAERSPWQKYKKDIQDAIKLLKEANGDNGKIGTAITNIGNACAEYLPQVERFATGLYSLFGIDDSGAKNAISAIQGLSIATEGIGQIISGDYMDGITNAVDGLSQAFNSLADMIDDFGKRMDLDAENDKSELKAISKSVDKIVEKMESNTMASAIEEYDKAIARYMEEVTKAQQNLADAFSESSSNIAGRYNHHSINYYMYDYGGEAEFAKINALLGKDIHSWGELWFLSPDELAKVERELPQIFAIIEKGINEMSSNATASSDDEAAREALEAYMKLAGRREEIEAAFNLKMTGTSVDAVKSDFKNMLADMTSDTETFSEKFSDMMVNSVVNAIMSNKYNEQLEQWYQSFSDAYSNDGNLNEQEIKELRDKYKQISDSAIKERDTLLKTLKTKTTQYFSDIEESFKSALLDMEGDAKDFSKTLTEIFYEALVDKFVLNVPLTVTIDDKEQAFDNLEDYLKSWKERTNKVLSGYSIGGELLDETEIQDRIELLEARIRAAIRNSPEPHTEELEEQLAKLKAALADLDSYQLTDEERQKRLQALNEELQQQLALLKQIAKTYADMAGWTLEQKIDASPLTNIGDSLLSALQDTSKGVEDWKKEIVESMTNDLIKEIVYNDAFKEQIRALQEQYVHLFDTDENGNRKLSDAEIQQGINDIANTLARLYDDAEKATEGLKELVPDIDTSPFDNLRDRFLDTLMDMQGDAESFKRKLQETLVKDLMERQVLDVPLTVTIDGEDKIFDNFDKYSEDWNKRYLDAVKSGNTELADALIDELMQVYGLTMQQAEGLRERLKEIAKDTTFKDMTNSWVSNLMDFNATAEDWAENIGRTMAQKIIEQMIVPTLIQPLLDNLQTAFDTAMSEHGEYGTDWDWKKVIGADGVHEALQAIQAAYPELKETITAILAALNITPAAEDAKEAFNDLTGTIISGLTDAEMTAEEFSKNIARTLTEQLMKQIVESQFAETMKGIQEDWAKALESGDTSAIEAIRQRIVQLYKDAGRATDELRGIFEEVKEGDTTFKDMADSWISALFDMDSTASDFGRQIGRTLVEKLVKELIVTKQLQKYLDDIQKAYDEAIGKEGATVESVLAAVTPSINAAIAATEKWKPVVEEIAKAFQELDKSTPLSDIRSKFLSQLMDIKSDTKDFAKSINEILTEAFIDKFVLGEEFDKRLEEWEQEYSSIMGGNYSDEDRATLLKQLRQAITTAKEGYTAEAQAIHELMGTANYADQQATMNLSDRATYEQADMLLNVNVSQMMIQEKILQAITGGTATPIDVMAAAPYTSVAEITSVGNTAKLILSTLQRMSDITTPNKDGLTEISRKFDTANDRLLAIVRAVQSIKDYVANNVAASRGILSRL